MWWAYPGKTRGQATATMLHALAQAGLSPAAVIRASTIDSAMVLGGADRVGSLEPNLLECGVVIPLGRALCARRLLAILEDAENGPTASHRHHGGVVSLRESQGDKSLQKGRHRHVDGLPTDCARP
jgi:hypothetical protein